MKKITVVIIGTGARGMHAYSTYFTKHSDQREVVAIA